MSLRTIPIDLQPEIDRICGKESPDRVFSLTLKDGRVLPPTQDGLKLLYSLGWHEALADKTPPSRILIPGA